MNKKFKQDFYKEQWFMWLLLVIFAPVGIFLMYKYNQNFSKRTKMIISIFAIVFSIYVVSNDNKYNNLDDKTKYDSRPVENQKKFNASMLQIEICDGINITSNCVYQGKVYETYIYYPPVKEQYHIETKTTSVREQVGFCTLCNDGTYSPSCATGRGACSHHGGVAQFNAPIYRNVTHKEEVKVIDSPAKEEKYIKIVKGQKESDV